MNGFVGPEVSWLALAPLLATGGAATLVVALLALRHRWAWLEALAFPVSMGGVLTAVGFLFPLWHRVVDHERYTTLGQSDTGPVGGAVAVDGLSTFLQGVVLVAAFATLLTSVGYLRREGLPMRAEHHVLVLLSTTGMLAMASAADLIVVFVALEVLSIPLYVLAGFRRDQAGSQEASLKYFVLGALSSAIFLYGVALVYGATGSTSLRHIRVFTDRVEVNDEILLVGIVLILVGLGFKISAVPFHLWTPDVYQGAPTPITGFMAAGAKAAGFAALIRVLIVGMANQADDWRPAVWALAVLSMVVASTTAIVQRDVKRMLAYSSISHAGFILIGLHTFTPDGLAGSLVYLASYTAAVVGTFAVVTALGGRGDESHALDDYRGLARREPVLAGALAFFLFAQAGIPLTSGFIAKLQVFSAAVSSDSGRDDDWALSLVIVGVLASAVAAYLYIRVVVAMYAGDDDGHDDGHGDGHDDARDGRAGSGAAGGGHGAVAVEAPPAARIRVDPATGLVIAASLAVTLYLGFLPRELVELADTAVSSLVG